MKIKYARYLLVLLVIVLISSCATQKVQTKAPEVPTGRTTVETPPVEETPKEAPKPTEVVEPEEKPATAEIEVMYAGFDPKELTVKKGTTVTFTVIQGKHRLTIAGKGTPNIEENGKYEYVANSVGKVPVFDIFTKKTATIIVTE